MQEVSSTTRVRRFAYSPQGALLGSTEGIDGDETPDGTPLVMYDENGRPVAKHFEGSLLDGCLDAVTLSCGAHQARRVYKGACGAPTANPPKPRASWHDWHQLYPLGTRGR
jgi:hypothetical protein